MLVDCPLAAGSYEPLPQEQEEEEENLLLDPSQAAAPPFSFEYPAPVEGKPWFCINPSLQIAISFCCSILACAFTYRSCLEP